MKKKTQSTRRPKRSNPIYDVDKAWFFARFADVGLSLRKVAARLRIEPGAVSVVGLVGPDLRTLRDRPPVLAPASAPIGGSDLHGLRFVTEGTKYAHLHDGVVFFRQGRTVSRRAVGRLSVVRVEGERSDRLVRVVLVSDRRGKFDLADLSGRVVEKGVALEFAAPVEWMRF